MARRGQFVDYTEVSLFVEEMRRAPKELQPKIRAAVKDAARTLVNDAKGRAAWSSRIPAAVKTRVSFAKAGAGIKIYVPSQAAPHARPYEGMAPGGNRRQFRHPVFADGAKGRGDWTWVSSQTRPFFRPAIEATRPEFVAAMTRALADVLPKNG